MRDEDKGMGEWTVAKKHALHIGQMQRAKLSWLYITILCKTN